MSIKLGTLWRFIRRALLQLSRVTSSQSAQKDPAYNSYFTGEKTDPQPNNLLDRYRVDSCRNEDSNSSALSGLNPIGFY